MDFKGSRAWPVDLTGPGRVLMPKATLRAGRAVSTYLLTLVVIEPTCSSVCGARRWHVGAAEEDATSDFHKSRELYLCSMRTSLLFFVRFHKRSTDIDV